MSSKKKLPRPKPKSEWVTIIVILLVLGSLVGYFFWHTTKQSFILKTKYANADGLRVGAEVQYAGVNIGNVEKLRFLNVPADDPEKDIFEVVLALKPTYRDQPIEQIIHKDAKAVLIATGLLSERSINIEPGSLNSAPTQNGDYIIGMMEPSIGMLLTNKETIQKNFEHIRARIDETNKLINSGRGNTGKYLTSDNELNKNVNLLFASTEELQKQLDHGAGTLPKFQRDKELGPALDRILNTTDKLRENLQKGQLDQLTNPEFIKRVDELQVRAQKLMVRFQQLYQRVDQGQGTITKLTHNKHMDKDIKQLTASIDHFSKVVAKREGSLGLLINDNRLADNVNAISLETMRLLYDIQETPRKYVKFTFF